MNNVNNKIDEELNIPDWDEWFMRMTYLVSSKSKDKKTKIGAVIVNNDHQIIKIGYNGFPVGVNDDISERHDRPLKYRYTAHAEANSIFFAARDGVKINGSILYTTGLCCIECSKAVIQSGIKCVIYHKQFNDKSKEFHRSEWDGHKEISTTMFKEADVKIIEYDKLLNISTLIDGNFVTV